jgi:hypothetical protein
MAFGACNMAHWLLATIDEAGGLTATWHTATAQRTPPAAPLNIRCRCRCAAAPQHHPACCTCPHHTQAHNHTLAHPRAHQTTVHQATNRQTAIPHPCLKSNQQAHAPGMNSQSCACTPDTHATKTTMDNPEGWLQGTCGVHSGGGTCAVLLMDSTSSATGPVAAFCLMTPCGKPRLPPALAGTAVSEVDVVSSPTPKPDPTQAAALRFPLCSLWQAQPPSVTTD